MNDWSSAQDSAARLGLKKLERALSESTFVCEHVGIVALSYNQVVPRIFKPGHSAILLQYTL